MGGQGGHEIRIGLVGERGVGVAGPATRIVGIRMGRVARLRSSPKGRSATRRATRWNSLDRFPIAKLANPLARQACSLATWKDGFESRRERQHLRRELPLREIRLARF